MHVDDTPPKYLRKAERIVSRMQSLDPRDNITLFTPVIAPPGTAKDCADSMPMAKGSPLFRPSADNDIKSEDPHLGDDEHINLPMDPFEPLGRALSAHHARVRHVPYLVRRGMTASHAEFADEAAAVVVVVYDEGTATTPERTRAAADAGGEGKESAAGSFAAQFDFARDVVDGLARGQSPGKDGQGATGRAAGTAPLVLVLVTRQPAVLLHREIAAFSTVLLRPAYDAEAARQIADMIFGK